MTEQQDVVQQENVRTEEAQKNFRLLEAKHRAQLEEANRRLQEYERKIQEYQSKPQSDEDDHTDEPYVDHKRLDKKLAKFSEKARQDTQKEVERAVEMAIQEERRQAWIRNNPDFYDTLQHAEKLYEKDRDLAETILDMPEGFERQKLVYKTIKSMGLAGAPKPSIQDKIDANKHTPYYQPGTTGASYGIEGDFSEAGQKRAWEKMKELQAKRKGF